MSGLKLWSTRLYRLTFVRFALVGAGGYVVDTAMLALDTRWMGLDPYRGRALSILTAMVFTWLGNRTLTFPEHAARGSLRAVFREWCEFAGTNFIGAAVNYSAYAALVRFGAPPFNDKYIALACGVLLGLAFNYSLSKWFVFRNRQSGARHPR